MTDNKTPTPADNEAQIIADEMPDQLRAEEQNAHLFEHFLEAIEADDTSKAAMRLWRISSRFYLLSKSLRL